jgi:CubicO group peptidase (beta-lactamase class C family)
VNYGAQFWLYDSYKGVPPDTFTAAGHGGQYATVVPSRQLVIARMGLQNGDYPAFVADVVRAISDTAEDARL